MTEEQFKDVLKKGKTGDSVTCKINDIDITDAKIYVEEDCFYVCQNEKTGEDAPDKLGYEYSYIIQNYPDSITDFQFVTPKSDLTRTWDNLKKGDVIENDGATHTIFEVLGDIFWTQRPESYELITWTKEEARTANWTIQQPTPSTDSDTAKMIKELEGRGYEVKKI